MKIVQKKKSGTSISYDVTAAASDVEQVLNQAHIAFANSMGMQPEPNKTVAQVAEERMGINDLDAIVRNAAAEMLVPMVLDKKNVVPAFMPTLIGEGELARGRDFRFHLDVELKPEYELSSYEPVHIEVPPFSVDESLVDAEIAKLREGYTSYVKDEDADPDHVLAAGDYAKMTLKVERDGEPVKGLNAEGRIYAVGAGHMPAGFEEEVVGMKVGETKNFRFDAPDFDEDMNEIAVPHDATVTITELLREEAPEIDDAWVRRSAPMFKNAEEFKANIRKNIEVQARESYKSYVRQTAVSELSKRFQGKIADEVYEQMMRQLRESIQRDLQQEGKTWDQFVEESGGEQSISMMLMLQARELLVQGYALDAVFRHFGLTVTDHDIEQVCHTMNPSVPPKQLHEQIRQNGQGFALRESAERFKANEYIVEHADIVEVA